MTYWLSLNVCSLGKVVFANRRGQEPWWSLADVHGLACRREKASEGQPLCPDRLSPSTRHTTTSKKKLFWSDGIKTEHSSKHQIWTKAGQSHHHPCTEARWRQPDAGWCSVKGWAREIGQGGGKAEYSNVLIENLIQSAKTALKDLQRRMPECPHIQFLFFSMRLPLVPIKCGKVKRIFQSCWDG